ncbi:hypothetical protein T08_11918 [Trichinella sp. T8]|nr:hypothetical protein T08_11918 [Trichinella sp. T8]
MQQHRCMLLETHFAYSHSGQHASSFLSVIAFYFFLLPIADFCSHYWILQSYAMNSIRNKREKQHTSRQRQTTSNVEWINQSAA